MTETDINLDSSGYITAKVIDDGDCVESCMLAASLYRRYFYRRLVLYIGAKRREIHFRRAVENMHKVNNGVYAACHTHRLMAIRARIRNTQERRFHEELIFYMKNCLRYPEEINHDD